MRLRQHLRPCLVLVTLLLLFFTYPAATQQLVAIFSCTQVDRPNGQDGAGGYAAAVGTFWNEDTAVHCWRGAHACLAFGLGLPGLLLLGLGFPLGLAAAMAANSHRLDS